MDREEEAPGSGFLNLDTLYDVHKKKDLNKIEVYRRIYQRCQDKVKKTNDRLGKMECFFEVPTFLLGTPIYDYDDLKSYIIFRLRENGITHCYFVDQHNLFISWRPQHIDKKRYQAAKKKYGLEPSIYENVRNAETDHGFVSGTVTNSKIKKGDSNEPDHSGMLKFSSEIGVPVNMDKIRMVEGPKFRLGHGNLGARYGPSRGHNGNLGARYGPSRGQISPEQEDFKPNDSVFRTAESGYGDGGVDQERLDRVNRFDHQSQERIARQERLDRQTMARKPPSRHMLNSWHNYFSRIKNGNNSNNNHQQGNGGNSNGNSNGNNNSNWANPYL